MEPGVCFSLPRLKALLLRPLIHTWFLPSVETGGEIYSSSSDKERIKSDRI